MSKFIQQQKGLYNSLVSCYCPAIHQTVYFTTDGFRHLLYRKRRPRNPREQHYRVALISYIKTVIMDARDVRSMVYPLKPIVMWSLSHPMLINGRKQIVKVILQKEGNGKIKFLSVMSKK